MLKWLFGKIRKTRLDESGSVAIQAALMLIALLGFVALGVEISDLLLVQRQQQAATDSAAMAAAQVLGASDPQTEARAVTAQLGFTNGVGGVSVTAANPPSSGGHAGDSNYVEVDVQQAVSPVLIALIHPAAFTVATRAVGVRSLGGSSCLMALSTATASAVSIANNAIIDVSSCGVVSNSNSNSAVALSNNATIKGPVTVAGDVALSPGATITGAISRHATATTDPYAGVALPAKPSQASTTPSGSKKSVSLQPGWYPNGWAFDSTSVSLAPGVYWVDSQLSLSNGATLSGTGVTLIIDGDYAINIGNNVTLNLTAPTSGSTAGLVFYGSVNNKSGVIQSFSNNATLNLTGAVYFPSQTIQLSNNVVTGVSQCTQLIASTLQLNNNATFNGNCAGDGVSNLGNAVNASLVE